jgi:hypothetical protein
MDREGVPHEAVVGTFVRGVRPYRGRPLVLLADPVGRFPFGLRIYVNAEFVIDPEPDGGDTFAEPWLGAVYRLEGLQGLSITTAERGDTGDLVLQFGATTTQGGVRVAISGTAVEGAGPAAWLVTQGL